MASDGAGSVVGGNGDGSAGETKHTPERLSPSQRCARATCRIALIMIPLALIVVGGMAAGGFQPLTNVFTKNGGIGLAVTGAVSGIVLFRCCG